MPEEDAVVKIWMLLHSVVNNKGNADNKTENKAEWSGCQITWTNVSIREGEDDEEGKREGEEEDEEEEMKNEVVKTRLGKYMKK